MGLVLVMIYDYDALRYGVTGDTMGGFFLDVGYVNYCYPQLHAALYTCHPSPTSRRTVL